MTWRPVLHGAEADRARALVAAIAGELAEPTDASLADGHAGLALLHGYRARAGEADDDQAALAAALDGITTVPWLFHGHAGIGFALAHLAPDASEPLAELDALIRRLLAIEPWTGDWELMTGAIGLGVYALERGDAAMVARVVHHLGARVEADGAWRSADADGSRYVDLGLAHGVAGAVAFLAAAIAAPGARSLLGNAVAWLRARERADAVPAYPMTEARRAEHQHTGVVDGWCHGDVSTALALVRAGEAAGELAWIAAGHATATRAAQRTTTQRAGLTIEGGLCHGEIGRAHILHRLGLVLGDDALLAAACDAYARTTRVAEAGLLGGSIGVALGLLAGYSDVSPDWDRAFLLG